jgi:hypothetical protein
MPVPHFESLWIVRDHSPIIVQPNVEATVRKSAYRVDRIEVDLVAVFVAHCGVIRGRLRIVSYGVNVPKPFYNIVLGVLLLNPSVKPSNNNIYRNRGNNRLEELTFLSHL